MYGTITCIVNKTDSSHDRNHEETVSVFSENIQSINLSKHHGKGFK